MRRPLQHYRADMGSHVGARGSRSTMMIMNDDADMKALYDKVMELMPSMAGLRSHHTDVAAPSAGA